MAFRNHLRAHHEVAREYGQLKRRLARKFRDNRDAYQEAKAGFIQNVLARVIAASPEPGNQAPGSLKS